MILCYTNIKGVHVNVGVENYILHLDIDGMRFFDGCTIPSSHKAFGTILSFCAKYQSSIKPVKGGFKLSIL